MMGTRSSVLCLKVAVASAGVVAAAVAMRLAAPGAAEFLSDEVPRIYGALRGWLTPPYLYFIINGIIISIAASSRFQKAATAAADGPDPAGFAVSAATVAIVRPEFVAPVDYEEARPEFLAQAEYGGAEEVVKVAAEEEEFVISRSSWSPKRRESREIPSEYAIAAPEKPLVSVRFGNRRSVKASPDGKALGVARPKRGETLESTWKAITDGRAVPLARHLKKSDTWGDAHGRGRDEAAALMRKAETFNDRGGRAATAVAGSPGSDGSSGGRLRREPSLGQDDLNRRVEAFIKKFNEEMRLQRQESVQQYMDMINSGSH